jgi:PAS domain S-box-containing protein
MRPNEQELLEQKVRESADLSSGIIGSAMDAIIAVDDAQRIVLFNAAAEKMFACSANEAIGSSVERFIPQRFRDGHSMRVRRFAESGVTNRTLHSLGNLWGLRANGEEFLIEASISKVDSGGKQFFTAVIRDVTERKRAEEALQASEDRFRLAQQAAGIGTFDWNVRTGVNTWTPALEALYGLPPGGFGGTQTAFENLVHPDDRARVVELNKEALKMGHSMHGEWRVVWPDGNIHWIAGRWQVFMDESGNPVRMIGVNGDITERKLAEEALRESEQRFRLATQVARMYAYDWDIKADSVVRSSEHVKTLRLTEPLDSNHRFVERIHPDDRPKFLAAITGLTPENPTGEVTYRAAAPDGSLAWLKSNGRGFFDDEGKLLRVIGMVVDVTDVKQAEEALAGMTRKLIEAQEQERARIGRELHDDVCQQLAMLSIELEQLQDKSADEVKSRLDKLREQLNEVSSDVQALSHDLHSSKLDYLGVVPAIKSWCKEFAERQGMAIDFNSDVQGGVPHEIGLSLFRVLQEGLHNVVKHSGVRRVEVQLRQDSSGIQLVVRDLGKGFDLDAALQGKGLGLTSMRERVRLVKGTISIDSNPIGGTTINVRVPLAAQPGPQSAFG